MSRASDDLGVSRPGEHEADEPVRYPTNHVVAVLDTSEQAEAAVAALTSGGFLDSEVGVASGPREADRVGSTTGRGGLAGLAMSIADWFGVENEEMELKDRYEQALRDGLFVLRVAAPTEARRERATRILTDQGAHTVTYLGRFTIEGIIPPNVSDRHSPPGPNAP